MDFSFWSCRVLMVSFFNIIVSSTDCSLPNVLALYLFFSRYDSHFTLKFISLLDEKIITFWVHLINTVKEGERGVGGKKMKFRYVKNTEYRIDDCVYICICISVSESVCACACVCLLVCANNTYITKYN